MKRILLFLSALFIATTAIAHTINWYVDGSVYHTTTCESGENVTPPTAPEKYGYTFQGWEGYTQIEYLESIGTQWIDTGFVPNDFYTFKTKITFTNNKTGQCYFGEATGRDSMLQISNDETYINVGYATDSNIRTRTNIITSETHQYVLHTGSNSCYLMQDNTNINTATNCSPHATNKIYLFGLNYGGDFKLPALCKMYYFQIYKNNTLVRDFIPVLDKYGTPCMYDKVERKFYYNQGTGQFIAGPIIGE